MKKIAIFLPLICFLLFMACTSEDLSPGKGENPVTEDSSGGIFLRFNLGTINTGTGTKASGTTYNPGEKDENHIENGKVFIYKKNGPEDSEGSFVCVAEGELPVGVITGSSGELSETVAYRNIELTDFEYDPDSEEKPDLYVLVVLNYNSDFVTPDPNGEQTFSTWATEAQTGKMLYNYDSTNVRKNYITMTNATGQAGLVTGDTFKPTTLAKLDPRDIKRGKFKDTDQCNTTVYVQRNVAKVKVSLNGGELVVRDKNFTIGEFTLQLNFVDWYLDRINTKSYPVMNITGLEDYYSSRSFFHSGTEFNRVHWAIDPNYSATEYSESEFTRSMAPWYEGGGNSLYCLENTMDYKNMIQTQTTRIVLRWSMEWWGSLNDNTDRRNSADLKLPSDYLKDSQGNEAQRKQDVVGNNFDDFGMFVIGEGKDARVWDFMHIQNALNESAEKLFPDKKIKFDIKQEKDDQTKKLKNQPGGYYLLKDMLTWPEEVSLTEDDWKKLGKCLNIDDATSDKIAYYSAEKVYNDNNEVINNFIWVYYTIRIRHFSDAEGDPDYIVWDGSVTTKDAAYNTGGNEDSDPEEGGRAASADPDNTLIADYNDTHLGRYGVVRNNFYDVLVKKVNNLGSPNFPPTIIPGDTDDMPENAWLEFSINVRPWTVRQNDFEF